MFSSEGVTDRSTALSQVLETKTSTTKEALAALKDCQACEYDCLAAAEFRPDARSLEVELETARRQ